MKLAFWRKDMSNSFVDIAKRMDDLIAQISETDAETKDYADKAVASHAKRLDLEAQLKSTEQELREAPGVIVDFLKALTVLPALVTEADSVLDAENAAAAAAAEAEANQPAVEEPTPAEEPAVDGSTLQPGIPADAATDPVGAAAALSLLGTTPVDAPAEAPVATIPTPEPTATEQPISVEEPIAGDLGLPGSDTLDLPGADTIGTPAPAVAEPAPEQPSEGSESPTVAEPAPGDAEMAEAGSDVDSESILPDIPAPASDSAPSVTEPTAPEQPAEGVKANPAETVAAAPVVAEPDAPTADTSEAEPATEGTPETEAAEPAEEELDPLTGLPKPQL